MTKGDIVGHTVIDVLSLMSTVIDVKGKSVQMIRIKIT
jgi:hypothetical protein